MTTQAEFLQCVKERLHALYGERFRALILFGSVARGDDDPESDIDLICLLQGHTDGESSKIHEAIYPLQLEFLDSNGRMLSIIPVNEDDYQRRIPLYMEARKEGVMV